MARGAEHREGDQRQQNRIEAGDDWRAGDASVAENLRDVYRGERQARESVLQRLARLDRKKPAENVEWHCLALARLPLPGFVSRIHSLRKQGFESLVDEGGGERAREPDPEHDREVSDLVFQGHPLADEFCARWLASGVREPAATSHAQA